MSPCRHTTGIGTQILVTGRTSGRHVENLVFHVLIAGGILEAQTVAEEVQVSTKLPVGGVLWLQVLVKLHIVRSVRGSSTNRIADRSIDIHTTSISRYIVIVIIVLTSLSYLCERSTQLTIREDLVALQTGKLCEYPAQ